METGLFGSKDVAAMGGNARAVALTKERRSEIAAFAAESRWGKVRRSLREAPLRIGNVDFECAVLDDETRVLSERAFARAIGSKRPGSHWQRRRKNPEGANLPVFLSANNLRPFISLELASALSEPIAYMTENGNRAHGIKAELIPQILDVFLKGRDAKALTKPQERFAQIADVLMRGLATTGIIALIDEATGWQDVRAKDALSRILEAFVQKELRPWVKTFPLDYYKEMYRLRGLVWPPVANRMPRYIGMFTNDLVYARLAPGVLSALKQVTPRDESGRHKQHFHRRLTEDTGHPKLLQHLGAVIAVMKMTQDGDWNGFMRAMDKHYPRHLSLPLLENEHEEKDAEAVAGLSE